MKAIYLFLVCLFLYNLLPAQDYYSSEGFSQANILDELNIKQDSRLDKMLKWHIAKNKKKGGMDGYRVEIFFSSGADAKNKALSIKANFLAKHSNHAVHIKFISPNFRVRVGDFRTKNEAWKLYKKIQRNYPAAFVVPDIIDFPLLKSYQYE